MANYFYVKSGLGTRTTDTSFTAAETGAFGSGNLTAANVYANLGALDGLTTPPVDGDFVYVSSAHAAVYDAGATVVLNVNGSFSGAGLTIVSVDDTDVTKYLPGASENLTDTADVFSFRFSGICAGVDIETGHDIVTMFSAISWIFRDCTLTVDGNNDIAVNVNTDGFHLRFENVIIHNNAVNTDIFQVGNGGRIEWIGGSLTGSVPSQLLVSTSGGAGGLSLHIVGVDLSVFTGIMIASSVAGTQDIMDILFDRCVLNASATPHGTFATLQQRFRMFGSDTTAGDALHRFEVADGAGSAKNNDTVYVTAGPTWYEGTAHSSIQVITTAYCNKAHPFTFELPAQYIDLGDTASDVVTLELVSDFTLTDGDISARMIYPDGTTTVVPRVVVSGAAITGSNAMDPMAGTALSTGALAAGDWTGEPTTGVQFYKLDLDTSGVAGEAAPVSIEITVAKTSIDGTASNQLFIHPVASAA